MRDTKHRGGMVSVWTAIGLAFALAGGAYALLALKDNNAAKPAAETPAATLAEAAPAEPSAAMAVGQFCRGRFEAAAEIMAALDAEETADPVGARLAGLLDEHAALMGRCHEARVASYTEHIEAMEAALASARWRAAVLATSRAYPWDGSDKTTMEAELAEREQQDWFRALARLTAAETLAKRVGLETRTPPETREEILERALAIGGDFESRQQWLEAYGNVYYYLTALAPDNREYANHGETLLRLAATSAIYAPDPNEDGITWQERRAGISRDLFYAGVRLVERDFASTPDYRQMALRGLRNCRLFGQIDKLQTVFESLGQPELVQAYDAGLLGLQTQVELQDEGDFTRLDLLDVFQAALDLNEQTVKLPEEVVIAEFAEGAASALDNYTYLVWPGDVAAFRKDMTNEFSGVGIVINMVNNRLTVDSLLEDAPAMRAGLDAGDVITAVDGQSTARITLEMAVRRITGERGTEVVLTIEREGWDEPRDFTITRDRIVVQTIRGLYRNQAAEWEYYADPNNQIGYVRVTNFSGETVSRFREVLDDLQGRGLKGLILDLRDNSGGYLNAAVEMADVFLSSGLIVSARSARFPQLGNQDYATQRNTIEQLPLAVLVNGASASASEIVAGALRDHGRAVVVGTQTYGKGSVQQIQEFRPYGAEMKITIAYYYLPSGRRVDRADHAEDGDHGVLPHVVLELTGAQREESARIVRRAGVLHRTDGAEGAWEVYDAERLLASDPQLALATLCLRGRLLADEQGIECVYDAHGK